MSRKFPAEAIKKNPKINATKVKKSIADGNPQTAILHQGLDGNPAKTGQIFTDNSSYIKKVPQEVPTLVIRNERNIFRATHKSDGKILNTSIGSVLIDEITTIEVSKGAKTDESFFYKLQITENFANFADKLILVDGNEPIDLSHNNHRSKFYQRKKLFSNMEKYRLSSGGFEFEIKVGVFKDGSKNLYCITEPI